MNAYLEERSVLIADKPELLSPKQAAEFLGRTPGTLSIWRCNQKYDLPFVKVGHSVMYDLRDLIRFVEQRKVRRKRPR
jgi:hypothetical protein